MNTTQQILNLLNPVLKSGKGSKQLLSKLSNNTEIDFKDILTSLDISENEKSAIIFELLNQVEGKKSVNFPVNKSEILEVVNFLSGKIKNHSLKELTSKELTSEGKSTTVVNSKLLNTATGGKQVQNLVVNEKESGNNKSVKSVQNASNATVPVISKTNGRKEQSFLNGIKLSNSSPLENFKKDLTLKNDKREITKVHTRNLNVLDKSVETVNVIKKFSAQIKTAQNSTPVTSNVLKKLGFTNTTENPLVLNTGSKIGQNLFNNLITASAEKALLSNVIDFDPKVKSKTNLNNVRNLKIKDSEKIVKSNIITGSGENKVFENKSELKISANPIPVESRPEESVKLDNVKTPIRIKDISKNTEKELSMGASGKVMKPKVFSDSDIKYIPKKDILEGKNVDRVSSLKDQIEKAVFNNTSHIVNDKNLQFSPYLQSPMSVKNSIKAFNSAGKRVNTVATKSNKVSAKKSENSSKQIQPNSSVIDLKVVQKNYSVQSDFSNFEKDFLNISNISGEKIMSGIESSEHYENNLVKLKTTFLSNGVTLSDDKMLNTRQMKISIKTINDELSKLQLRISPKGLGNITIDIQKEGNALYTKFVVETVEVAGLIKDILPELKETLTQQGLKMEDTQISSKDENLRHYLSQQKNNEFEEKSNGKRSSLSSDYHTEIAPELLANKPVRNLSPYSTVEYLV